MASQKAVVSTVPESAKDHAVSTTGKARGGWLRRTFLIILLAGIVGCGQLSVVRAQTPSPGEPKAVLLLNSYNKGFPWSDNIVRAVEDTFAATPEAIDLWVEYMDTKRFADDAYLAQLALLYRHKFQGRRFAAIITSDNAAFQFMLRHRQDLFADTPVVFCGINGFVPALIADQRNITGVAELPDFRSTILLIPRLLPGTREIIVISPDSISADEDRKTIEGFIPSLGAAPRITFWQGMDLEQTLGRAATLPPGTVILSSDVITTRSGHVISNLEKIRRIAAAAPAPVFIVREEDMGSGAIGGRLVSGHAQGRQAASIVLDILRGAKADDISVLAEGTNPFMFDFNVMKRFGLFRSDLPDGSIIINQPAPPYERYRTFMWAAAIAVLVLLLFTGALIVTILGRRAAERALRESEERLRALIENSPMAIYLKDLQGRYLIANEGFRRRFGLPSDQIIGKSANEFMPPDLADEIAASDDTVFSTRAPLHREVDVRYADGSLHSLVMTKFPTFDSRGQVNGLGFISLDITDAKTAATAARELQNELAYVSRLSSMGEMAAGFAHELNQPLTAISNFATGCVRRIQRPDCDAQTLLPALAEIAQQAQRAGDIIRHIRGFVGKKNEERTDHAWPEIDINAAIRAAAGLVGNEALRYGANLRLKLAPVLPPVQADIIQIQQVVVNLARNAMEAMNETASDPRDLTIQTGATATGEVEIRVLDNGPGIAGDLQSRLFEPFFTTKTAGMGMGLSICRSIAEAHGGQLSADNRSRGGAEFRLTLPPAHRDQPPTS